MSHAQRIHNGMRQFILQGEQIAEIAIVILRPEMKSVVTVDQLRGHPNALAGAAHAAFENHADIEVAGNLPHVDIAAFVGERGGA